MSEEIHVDDIGTIFRLTFLQSGSVVDLSTATTKQIWFKKPSGEILTKTASFYTDGTDGILQYTVVSGDLDEKGTYEIQGFVVITAGTFHSDVQTFQVNRNIGG